MKIFVFIVILLSNSVARADDTFEYATKAKLAYVYDVSNDTVLISKNPDNSFSPGSMSQLMTLYMAFEYMDRGLLHPDEKFPVSSHASSYGGSTMFLDTSDRVKVSDLLRGIAVLSGNDASAVLAENLSPTGTEAGFANLMTMRAQQLGMTNSTFQNSNGWPHPSHRTTARDLATLAVRIIDEYPQFYDLFSEPEFKFDGRAPSNTRNRNPLLGLGIGADGLITGRTLESGYGLVGSAKRGERRIVFVLSGLSSVIERADEAEAIVNWAFRHAVKERVILTCNNDPAKCGAVELCRNGTEIVNGKRFWRSDPEGQPYAAAAKDIGLSCKTETDIVEKTFRVANGTGFFVTESGDVVTNQHVISGCNEVQVHSGGKIATAAVVSQDKVNDLALLKTKMKTQSVFSLATENPYLLQDIVAAGFPFGESVSSTIKVTKGVVSSLSGLGDNSGQIQIDAALQPGNSGGPIIDENGNVVAVAVAKLDLEKSIESFGVVPENVNFGIKLSSLKTFLDDNNVNYKVGKEREIKNSALGKLATQATVLLSCWMTEARIETMQNSKAMFKEILR